MFFSLTPMKAMQIFHILRQGSVIITNILLAKTFLSTAEIGNYELLFYIGFVFSFFWTTGLIQGFLSIYPTLQQDDKPIFLFQNYLLFLLISLLLFTCLTFWDNTLLYLFTNQSELNYFSLFIIYFLLNTPTYVVDGYYLLLQKPKSIVGFGIFSFGLHVFAVIVPLWLGKDLAWSFYGLILLAGLKHIWLLLLLFRHGRFQFSFFSPLLRKLLIFSSPLMLYALLGGLMQAFDNWLVTWYFGGDEAIFAVFRYGAKELPLALALASAFSNTMLPVVASNLSQACKDIRQKSKKLYHLLFPLSILAMLCSSWLFPLVFNSDFAASAAIFNVFLLTLISRVVFPHTILVGLGKTNIVLIISILELLINIIASLFLVQSYGLAGIAMGSVIAYSFEKIAHAFYLYFQYQLSFSSYTSVKWLSGYGIALIGAYLFTVLVY